MTIINRSNLAHSLRSTAMAAAATAAIISASAIAGHGLQPVQACGFGCDRPGTPNNVTTMINVGPLQAITVFWNNTASESTCVEFATTKDGQPVDLGAGCVRNGIGGAGVEHEFDHLDRSVNYCFQVRARDWNNGDPQDGLVSDQWSAPACATVPVPAPAPAPKADPLETVTTSSLGTAEMHTPSGITGSGVTPATTVLNNPLFGDPKPVPTPIGRPH